MVEVASIFRDTIDGRIDTSEGAAHLEAISPAAPFANGFYHANPVIPGAAQMSSERNPPVHRQAAGGE
jgi:hypothetical protein